MEWTEETIQRLRALWQEGHSTAEIGRRMGISKNAVVGKAHRLDLPSRPSPIRRQPAPRPARLPGAPTVVATPAPAPARVRIPAPRPAVPAVAALPATPVGAPVGIPVGGLVNNVVSLRAPQPAPPAAPPPVATSPEPERAPAERASADRGGIDRPSRRLNVCCWPLGEPGTKAFRFCGGETLAGKPYCGEHAQLAYVRVKDRRDSVA